MADPIDNDLNRHLKAADDRDLFAEAVADEVEILESWRVETLLSHMPGKLQDRLFLLLEEYATVRVEARGFEVEWDSEDGE